MALIFTGINNICIKKFSRKHPRNCDSVFRLIRGLSFIGLFASLLVACTVPAPQKTASPVVAPVKPVVDYRAQKIKRLLREAEKALAGNKLTYPRNDNALDRYKQVLQMEPGNLQAKSGLQMIPLRYVEMARGAAGKNDIAKAKTWLKRALTIDATNRAAKQLLKDLSKTTVPAAAKTDYSNSTEENLYLIDPLALKNKAPSLHPYLQLIAQRARINGMLAIITAPTDAQGRWIYRQMKQALPGFRLRGDIRRGPSPKVRLESP